MAVAGVRARIAAVACGSVEPGEPKVHQDDVGCEPLRGVGGITAVGDGADDLEAVTAVEQELEGRSVDLVVLDEQHAHRHRHSAESSSG